MWNIETPEKRLVEINKIFCKVYFVKKKSILEKYGGKCRDCLELQRGQEIWRNKKLENIEKRLIGGIDHNEKSIGRKQGKLEIK